MTLLPPAEGHQLHPEDFRHPRHKPRRLRIAARRLVAATGIALAIAAMVTGLALIRAQLDRGASPASHRSIEP